jgi:hypothetical protein
MDFSKLSGGKKGQKQLSEAIAMESASRVMTRKALDTLKAIATGEYKPAETKMSEDSAPAEVLEEEKPEAPENSQEASTDPQLSESGSSSAEEVKAE